MFKPDICIYHGSCDDGFTAAWAVWKRWPDCVFFPGIYGKEPPAVAGKRVLMVDFSYPRAVLEKLSETATDITIIDHHKTAQADLETFAILNPVDADDIDAVLPSTQPGLGNIRAWFDMAQSGAAMTWKFVHPDTITPKFISYVEDRDLWRFRYGDETKQFSAALRTYSMDFATWDKLVPAVYDMVDDGKAVLRSHNANIEKFCKDAYLSSIGGHDVPTVNVPYHYASDVAHVLLQKFPDASFAACWFRRADDMVQYSLRSDDMRVDVSEIAKLFGGGGHRNAAGFQIPADKQLSTCQRPEGER